MKKNFNIKLYFYEKFQKFLYLKINIDLEEKKLLKMSNFFNTVLFVIPEVISLLRNSIQFSCKINNKLIFVHRKQRVISHILDKIELAYEDY